VAGLADISIEANARDRLTRLKATTRALTFRYLLALSLIGTLAIGGFLVLQETIKTHEASSSIITMTARQSKLAQEVAATARHLIESQDPSAHGADRGALFEAAHAMEQAHLQLTDPASPLGQPLRDSVTIRAFYFDYPLNLDRKIRSFLRDAYQLSGTRDSELHAGQPTLRRLQTQAAMLLIALDALVDRLEADARESVRRSRLLEAALLATTLVMLGLEALFIFRPIVRRVWREGAKLIESRDRLVELAHFDPLTKLPNRTLLQLRLDMALAQGRRDGSLTAVLQLDLDHFKDVNDSFGHAAGDHLLSELSSRLQDLLRATDTVARTGGDEFAIILTGQRTAHQVGKMAETIVQAARQPVIWRDGVLQVGASIGIALCPSDDEDPEQLLRSADIALYQAKASGRSAFTFFVGEMRARIEHRARVERDLRRALDSDQFEILYQPQLRLSDGVLVALEASIGWRHPELGMLEPESLLPVAEETGLIVPLGLLLLHRSLEQMALWHAAGIAPPRIALDVAGAQLRADDFVVELDGALAKADIGADRLELEIAESTMLGHGQDQVADCLVSLRQRGIGLTLDHFGTCHGSLTQLKQIRIDRLKIDRALIGELGSDRENAAIVRAVLHLGRSLGHEIIADGIETREQLDHLGRLGCACGQGSFFGQAAPALAVEPVLRSGGVAMPDAGGRHAIERNKVPAA
jgi:diguanylate cyclase (GGDEF)-like protein